MIDERKFHEGLRTKKFGRNIVFAHNVRSTNDLAKELAACGADEGTVVIAETQKAGRGRLRRKWFSPEGGLWFSVVLRPTVDVPEAVKLVFAAGLSVAEVLDKRYGLSVQTKWPNDILVHGLKICGILTEMNTTDQRINFVVVGIGVNVNVDVEKAFPESHRNVVTSLENELGHRIELDQLLNALLENLEKNYELFVEGACTAILQKWKKYAHFLGHEVEVTGQAQKLSGLAFDVDSSGALVIKLEDGTLKHVFVGDVSITAK